MTRVPSTVPMESADPIETLRVPRPRAAVIAVGALLAALVIAGPVVAAVQMGSTGYEQLSRSYPGAFTALSSALLRGIAELSVILVLGTLVVLLVLTPRRAPRRLDIGDEIAVRVLQAAALAWSVSAGLLVLVDAADANGQPISRIFDPGALSYLISSSYLPGAWIVTMFCALGILFGSFLLRRWLGAAAMVPPAILGLLAPLVVGQVLVGPGHDIGLDSAVLGSIAFAVVGGAILVLTAVLGSGRVLAPESLSRLGWIAVWAVPVALVVEIIVGVFKLQGGSPLENPTGLLILARITLVALLGVLLVVVRLRARAGALTERTVWTSAIIGSALVAGVLAVGGAMTRIPPPHYFVPTSIMEILLGFDVTPTPTAEVLLFGGRINVFFLALGLAGLGVYAWALLRVRRRGDSWPVGRTVAWTLGWLVIILGTSSGIGRYSAPSFSLHMTLHMALNMLAPLLLCMGGFVTLLLRAVKPAGRAAPAGPYEWISALLGWRVSRFIYTPMLVFVVFVGSYYALYLTPLFGEIMRFHWAHQLMNVHFIVIGYLFYGLVIGVDRPPRPLPHVGKLGFVLAAMPFHAFFGVVLMTSTSVIAENFYTYLGSPWATDLLGDQYVGGGIAWAGGELPLILVVAALGIQWSRSDEREAKRKDRHLDRGLDDEFEVYNDMLQKLSDRDPVGPVAAGAPIRPLAGEDSPHRAAETPGDAAAAPTQTLKEDER